MTASSTSCAQPVDSEGSRDVDERPLHAARSLSSLDATLALAAAFFAAAVLYASVGHAGASAYLAAMALVGIAPATMRPTALALNILVASIVTVRFHLAGQLRWRAVAPFLLGSIPLAFVGGAMTLPTGAYKVLAGL